ncbi:MAG: S8 family serine peptidase [Chloroflexi bacterium]|nr:S8 family serine peptidase [Chloroflexota bacterium]
MSAFVDPWTLEQEPQLVRETAVRAARQRQVEADGDLAVRPASASGRIEIERAAEVARDLGRGAIELGDACRRYAAFIAAEFWPTFLIATPAAAGTGPTSLAARYGFALEAAPGRSFPRLGVVAVRLPPHRAFLGALAALPHVQAIVAPESPIYVVEPPAVAPELVDTRALLSLSREDQERFGRGVRVCVVDSGLDFEHPDLSRVVEQDCANFSAEPDLIDRNGHGTHCAGIVGGDGRASDGLYCGVAPRTTLLIAKVFDHSGSTNTEGVLRALEWAVTKAGADVVSMSLGAGVRPTGKSVLTLACEKASELGTIVCVSAGNRGPADETITPPGDARSALTVAAIDRQRRVADFSSRGSADPASPVYGKPDGVAPGVAIVAPRSRSCGRPPQGGSAYTSLSGTSMACPAIGGAVALLKSCAAEYRQPADAATIREVFLAACHPLQRADGQLYRQNDAGQGLVNLAEAFDRFRRGSRNRDAPAPPAPPAPPDDQDRAPAAGRTRAEVLALEMTFVNAVEGHFRTLPSVHDPRTPRWCKEIRLQEHTFPPHCGTDTQRLIPLLLAGGHTPGEAAILVNQCPVNRAVGWQVQEATRNILGQVSWRDARLVLCVASWSPLEQLARREGRGGRPGAAQDVVRLANRLQLDPDVMVWLALGATTGWVEGLPAVVNGHVYCCYFEPVAGGGWKVRTSLGLQGSEGADWFERVAHPETEEQLLGRARRWFEDAGRRKARKLRRLAAGEAVEEAAVPRWIVERLFEEIDGDQPDWWSYERDLGQLHYLGP